ncbi:MAG TPA: hypothetical protein ENJ08_09540 [Gammaproteobacteria bacterium]|nr:hypothetical protein [Gammaproteobacteria bacterium]
MNRFYQLVSLCCMLNAASAYALDTETGENSDYITYQQALSCIQSSQNLEARRQQLRLDEADKAYISSKVMYLQNEVRKRRKLIESLDQRHTQQNNENYNQLVNQFEALLEEHRATIELFDKKQRLFLNQHKQFSEIEYNHNARCLQQTHITKSLYNEVCSHDESSWCRSFYF